MPFKDRKTATEWQKQYQNAKVARGICEICLEPRYMERRQCLAHYIKRITRSRLHACDKARANGKPQRLEKSGRRNIQSFISLEEWNSLKQMRTVMNAVRSTIKNKPCNAQNAKVS